MKDQNYSKAVEIQSASPQRWNKESLLCPEDTAEWLGVSVKTLALWRCLKRYPGLRYVKIGRRIRYTKSDVQAFIESRTVGGGTNA